MNRSRFNRANAVPTNAKLRGFMLSAKKSDRSVQAVTPFRIQGNKQILSVPTHNFQLKLRKNFRIRNQLSEGSFTVDFAGLRTAMRAELGALTAPGENTGEVIALHSIHAYSSTPATQTTTTGATSNFLYMGLKDAEETATGGANASTNFEDTASFSGVAHVAAVFPVNNRPTFSATAPNNTIAIITNAPNCTLTVDVEATYIRTPAIDVLVNAGLTNQSRLGPAFAFPSGDGALASSSPMSLPSSAPPLFVPGVDPSGLNTGSFVPMPDQRLLSAPLEYSHHCPDCHYSFQSLESLAAHTIEHEDSS
jgi:hypothetical protein